MNTKLLFIIGAVLIMGEFYSPYLIIGSTRKEKNKVGNGLKDLMNVDDKQSFELKVEGYVNSEKNIEMIAEFYWIAFYSSL